MSGRGIRGGTESVISKLVTKAIRDRGLIQNGDRILIACSGGKDSTVLAWALAAVRRATGLDYRLEAIHISTDFCACCKKSALSSMLESWGIPFTDLYVPVIGRLKEGRSMNCYWCSTQRRTELLKYACENGFNKIALGHHLDDIIETFFMNLLGKGEFSTMPMLLEYQKYPVSIIRPLGLLEERQIIDFAGQKGIMKAACTCPYGKNSNRKTIRSKITALTDNSGAVKRRIFAALSSGPEDLLVDLTRKPAD